LVIPSKREKPGEAGLVRGETGTPVELFLAAVAELPDSMPFLE
jgi:hypothetical protein